MWPSDFETATWIEKPCASQELGSQLCIWGCPQGVSTEYKPLSKDTELASAETQKPTLVTKHHSSATSIFLFAGQISVIETLTHSTHAAQQASPLGHFSRHMRVLALPRRPPPCAWTIAGIARLDDATRTVFHGYS